MGSLSEKHMKKVRLNIGSGNYYWPGFINCDAHSENSNLRADCKKLPFDADYADEIHAIHFIEHIGRLEVNNMLMDWARVLKPGGKIFIEVPCLNKISKMIIDGEKNIRMTTLGIYGDPMDKNPAMMHQWGYTVEELSDLLLQCGYKDVSCKEPIFHHPRRDMRIEAVKP